MVAEAAGSLMLVICRMLIVKKVPHFSIIEVKVVLRRFDCTALRDPVSYECRVISREMWIFMNLSFKLFSNFYAF